MKVITTTTEKLRSSLFALSLRRKYVISKDILHESNFTLMIKGADYMYIHVPVNKQTIHMFMYIMIASIVLVIFMKK